MLNIVTPAYVYWPGPEGYADAVVYDASWDELPRDGFRTDAIADLDAIRRARASAQARLAGGSSRPRRGA